MIKLLRKFWNWLTGGKSGRNTVEEGRKTAEAVLETAKDLHLATCATVIRESKHIVPVVVPPQDLFDLGVCIKAASAKMAVIASKSGLIQIAAGLGKVAITSTMAVGTLTAAGMIAAGMILGGIILNRLCRKMPERLSKLNDDIKDLNETFAGFAGGSGATA